MIKLVFLTLFLTQHLCFEGCLTSLYFKEGPFQSDFTAAMGDGEGISGYEDYSSGIIVTS
jgi:hypothetical protein